MEKNEESILNIVAISEFFTSLSEDLPLIALRYYGYRSREVAEILNISEVEVCRKLKKIKKEVKKILET